MIGPFKTLQPDWDIPGFHACTLLAEKEDGTPVSFSLQTALGDTCRRELQQLISPGKNMVWLRQVHGNNIVELPLLSDLQHPEADASFTRKKGCVCAVLTADCVPVVYANPSTGTTGVVHAGRRGIEQGLPAKMLMESGNPLDVFCWIGPAIAARSYRVNASMRDYFLSLYPAWNYVFEEVSPGQYTMDLYTIVRLQLQHAGVPAQNISGGHMDTFTNPLLHSARRDGEASGRMATLAWMD